MLEEKIDALTDKVDQLISKGTRSQPPSPTTKSPRMLSRESMKSILTEPLDDDRPFYSDVLKFLQDVGWGTWWESVHSLWLFSFCLLVPVLFCIRVPLPEQMMLLMSAGEVWSAIMWAMAECQQLSGLIDLLPSALIWLPALTWPLAFIALSKVCAPDPHGQHHTFFFGKKVDEWNQMSWLNKLWTMLKAPSTTLPFKRRWECFMLVLVVTIRLAYLHCYGKEMYKVPLDFETYCSKKVREVLAEKAGYCDAYRPKSERHAECIAKHAENMLPNISDINAVSGLLFALAMTYAFGPAKSVAANWSEWCGWILQKVSRETSWRAAHFDELINISLNVFDGSELEFFTIEETRFDTFFDHPMVAEKVRSSCVMRW